MTNGPACQSHNTTPGLSVYFSIYMKWCGTDLLDTPVKWINKTKNILGKWVEVSYFPH